MRRLVYGRASDQRQIKEAIREKDWPVKVLRSADPFGLPDQLCTWMLPLWGQEGCCEITWRKLCFASVFVKNRWCFIW